MKKNMYRLFMMVAMGVFVVGLVPAQARRKRSPKKNYAKLCSSCHGDTGHGDGDMAADLDPKPRSFADPAWKAKVKGRDKELTAIILEGGEKYKLSPQMKPFADKLGKKDAEKLAKFIQTL